jgi:oligopeptide/dipeptide ABC transporter ATP-binding protein
MNATLTVETLNVTFQTKEGVCRAVNDISFEIKPHEALGIVGESGCGKSVTALAVMRLIQEPPGKIGGNIYFEGQNLLALSKSRMRRIRGDRISMIFQEPTTSLNPVFTIGSQIAEAIHLHQKLRKTDSIGRAVEILRRVGLPSPEKRFYDYPHRLSGGMKQRAMIAMALSSNPKLLIADEPTTALDVTIQAQILRLLGGLQEEVGMAIMFISHDLGVIAEMASRVMVLYAGKIVEEAPVSDLFANPLHPYTKGLIHSLIDIEQEIDRTRPLPEIPGIVPNPYNHPDGCRFHPRCASSTVRCKKVEPVLKEVTSEHSAACWLFS